MRALTLAIVVCVMASVSDAAAGPLRVVATTSDLASLVQTVGGDEVEVTHFVRGGQDPHFVEARPSFIRALSRAQLFVHVGLQLEAGWVPALIRSARNSRVQPGAEGNLDASISVPPLGVRTGEIDRSMGDVHATGNPHYLTDPVNGLRVARAIRDRLIALRPDGEKRYRENATAFEQTIAIRLVGEPVAAAHGSERLVQALLAGRLEDALGDTLPAGWLGAMKPHRGKQVVADHDLWPYFARRFGLEIVAFLEPLPGITPTTRHLSEVASLMKRRGVRVILSASYFHPRYAEKVAVASDGRIVEMANQVGAREGVTGYLEMVDWNVGHLANALD